MAEEKKDSEFVMPKRTFGVEFWVGVFTIAGVLCFGYLSINIAGMRISEAGYYTIHAEFDNISGLQEGAAVEIAGVPIGEVKQITLDETIAVVSMKIEDRYSLRDDDIAAIRTKGIIGERYVKISPGGSDEKLEPGATIIDTESTVEMEDVIGKVIHSLESKDKDEPKAAESTTESATE